MSEEPRVWKHHSRIKLRLLRRYLYMCSTIYPDVQYFETHGGEGRILFKDGLEEDGSALIAARNSKHIKCVIMEYDKENVKKLRELLPIEDYPNVIILHGNSNLEINRILENIIKYKFSIGFIDPDSPKQLKWSTIIKISNHSYFRKRDGFLRKPELIINFPIKGIKQNAGFLIRQILNLKLSVTLIHNFMDQKNGKPFGKKREKIMLDQEKNY